MNASDLKSHIVRLRHRHGGVKHVACIINSIVCDLPAVTILVDTVGHTEHCYGDTFEEAVAAADAYVGRLITQARAGELEAASWGMAA